ncbi:winged helix-turn-helix transcriptional regulator [Foetidibacter luteolus]|uniref:winged helix-turn-helix transcriptional regulator n=1 Tax=Foetidibacter luteolus TaxID=2608880 RepID=UPI00129BCDDE|nr:helix-turn-helix domain-containing protein [Foetidibacter luteolus]
MTEGNFKKFEFYDDCPVRNVLDRVGDKWSILIISILGECGTMRFNQLHQLIGNISQKMLTVTLRALEADGLVSRTMYPEIPPRVEYCLTPLGESLLPALEGLTRWAAENMPAVLASRQDYKGRTARVHAS